MELQKLLSTEYGWAAMGLVSFSLFLLLLYLGGYFTSLVFLCLCGVCVLRFYAKKNPDHAVSRLASRLLFS